MLLFGIGFLEIGWLDLIDVLLVTVLLYNLYKLVKGSMALKIFIGFLAVYLFYLVVRATEMALLTEILGEFMGVGVIAVLILFQNEIRRFLLMVGKSTDLEIFQRWGKKTNEEEYLIEPILAAMRSMSATLTGALIVVSHHDPLKSYIDSGDLIDAQLSKRLITSIFFKNAPLHDGAMIIFKNRIAAARCILPVSQNPNIPATMGLRHRAAIGLTELTDAAVLVVSEETGKMSFIHKGEVAYNLSVHEIRNRLLSYFEATNEQESDTTDTNTAPATEDAKVAG